MKNILKTLLLILMLPFVIFTAAVYACIAMIGELLQKLYEG